jgi:hypothetical protein
MKLYVVTLYYMYMYKQTTFLPSIHRPATNTIQIRRRCPMPGVRPSFVSETSITLKKERVSLDPTRHCSQTSKNKIQPQARTCSRFLSGVEVYHTSTTNLYSINTDATYQIRAHFLHAPHGTGGQKFNQGFRQGETFHVFRQVQIRVPFTILSQNGPSGSHRRQYLLPSFSKISWFRPIHTQQQSGQ